MELATLPQAGLPEKHVSEIRACLPSCPPASLWTRMLCVARLVASEGSGSRASPHCPHSRWLRDALLPRLDSALWRNLGSV